MSIDIARAVLTGHTERVEHVTIAPDGTWLATSGDDHTVRIWDAATGWQRILINAGGSGNPITDLAIAPSGTWLATTSVRGVAKYGIRK